MEDHSVHFTTLRDLESFEGNFVIPLDQTINMVGAYSDSSHLLSNVEQTKFGWTMKLNSDGTTYSGRKLGLPGMDMGESTPWLNAHGLMMWGGWTILGMV